MLLLTSEEGTTHNRCFVVSRDVGEALAQRNHSVALVLLKQLVGSLTEHRQHLRDNII